MKIEWMGHACFSIETDAGTRIVTDPFDGTVGYPMPWGKADIVTMSHGHFDHNHYEPLNPVHIADEAKEYVFDDVKITVIDESEVALVLQTGTNEKPVPVFSYSL